ncbi:LytTR family DNA-binding domain-containing protein [Planktotalea sp.]|uniref:LytTR family DNA-binding domain-containing protein n=1 Tax=Planktotalea sp. TaxID=2029877 RepID=UPI0025D36952|nr:LytTR family DNA-binding domain-containing protein [Planktotalea sp.]
MNDSPTQHALREIRRAFTSRLTLLSLAAVVALLGISGPFGTLEHLAFGPRLAYWAVIVPLTFGIGMAVSAFVAHSLGRSEQTLLVSSCVIVATAISVGITVLLINWLAFGIAPFNFTYAGPLLASVMATAAVIAGILYYVSGLSEVPAQQRAPTTVPTLMDRIALDKRGSLISMSVQDHYVEVTTTAGSSLLLMRLTDAMRETSGIDGLQVHRSHWVERAHVVATERDADKALLTLSDGRTLPASRSHIKALKDAGILPR